MKNFVEDKPGLKLALNFHAWGDVWISPYSYEKLNNLNVTNPTAFNIIDEFKKEAPLDNKAKVGNAFQTLGYYSGNTPYLANGEASDWMMHE